MVPNGWELSGLGDVCEPKTGLQTGPFGSQLHASDYVPDGIPVVMPKDMINGGISTTSIARISPEKVSEVAKHKLKLGDIVFSRRGDLGRFAVVKSENVGWICGTGCMRARLNGTVAPEFVFCQLITHGSVRWLEDNAVGQTMPNLNTEILSQLPLRFPPLPEQRKIADILSAWDRAIELTEKLIAAKQKRKQALMQQLLTGKVRLGGSEAQWTEKRLGKLATFVNGRAFKPADWKDSGIPIIRIQNLNGSSDFNYFQGECDERHRVFPGDLLFSWSGSRGTSFGPCFWHRREGVLNQHIFRVLPHDGVQQRFLGHALEYVTVLIERKAHGSAGLVHVTKKELEKYTVKVPSLPVQENIAAILDNAEREVSLLTRRFTALKRQKTGLMQQLLTGKVRVNVDAETVKG